jgi:hypothetical protein
MGYYKTKKKNERREEILTDFFGKAAVMDSLRFRSFSPTPSAVVVLLLFVVAGAPVVVDWRRIHGKFPRAMSTRDSRRVAARDRGLLPLIPLAI